MKVKIGKDFIWEMAHRLPFHEAGCRNIHGHSYKMRVELTGSMNENSMILDFYDVAKVVQPLIDKIDHAFICDENDTLMLDFLKQNNFKYYLMNQKHTTAERMSIHFLQVFAPEFAKYENLDTVTVRVYETADAFAEVSTNLR